jgi:hypothetical protein
LGRWSPRGIEMRPLCLVALCCAASRLVFSHCVRARREFAPAGDSLSLLVQRKEAKKAPPISIWVSAVRVCCLLHGTAFAATRLAAQTARSFTAAAYLAHRGVLHRSIWQQCGLPRPRRTPVLVQRSGEVRLGTGRSAVTGKGGAVRAARRVAAKAVPWSTQQPRPGDTQMGFEVLWYPRNFAARSERIPPSGPLPTFFAPAKKVGRRPGRIPGGLSRTEIKPRSARPHGQPTC